MLHITHPATEWSLRTGKQLVQYISDNHKNWIHYANDNLLLGIRDEDLVLVSGFTRTAAWTVAAGAAESVAGFARLQGQASMFAAANLTLEREVASSTTRPVESRSGPDHRIQASASDLKDSDQDCDQNIFLRYYKLKRRFGLFRTIIQAAGRPRDLPFDGEGNTGAAVPASDHERDGNEVETESQLSWVSRACSHASCF